MWSRARYLQDLSAREFFEISEFSEKSSISLRRGARPNLSPAMRWSPLAPRRHVLLDRHCLQSLQMQRGLSLCPFRVCLKGSPRTIDGRCAGRVLRRSDCSEAPEQSLPVLASPRRQAVPPTRGAAVRSQAARSQPRHRPRQQAVVGFLDEFLAAARGCRAASLAAEAVSKLSESVRSKLEVAEASMLVAAHGLAQHGVPARPAAERREQRPLATPLAPWRMAASHSEAHP
jgi:hypothetical protein